MSKRTRTVTTDGDAIITNQGRLITTKWRSLTSGHGSCRAYQGYTWVVLRQPQGYLAQRSGNGMPAARRYFRSQDEAVRWLETQSTTSPREV